MMWLVAKRVFGTIILLKAILYMLSANNDGRRKSNNYMYGSRVHHLYDFTANAGCSRDVCSATRWPKRRGDKGD